MKLMTEFIFQKTRKPFDSRYKNLHTLLTQVDRNLYTDVRDKHLVDVLRCIDRRSTPLKFIMRRELSVYQDDLEKLMYI